MAPPQQDIYPHSDEPPTGEVLVPDDNITAGSVEDGNPQVQRPYWHRICPQGVLIPPPQSSFSDQRHAFPQQSPSPSFPLEEAPVDGDSAQSQATTDKQLGDAVVDEALDLSPGSTAQGTQSNSTHAHDPHSPETAILAPETQPLDRKRCEVWPLTYRSNTGLLRVLWCVQIDGESSYHYQPPNLADLSRRYHLVYFPDLASHSAQFNQ
ncbi:hypothetical protein VTI28DRAFT_1087 [Corynascus sepedonium]